MIIEDQICIEQLTGDAKRRLYVSLPDDIEEGRYYPVLYMFDGHNVFFDEDATYGKSWGMKDYLEETRSQLIVVGVECNHKGKGRLHEYSPFPVTVKGEGRLKGLGPVYMDWLVNELKPRIDAEFPTIPDREHTYIAGSSMGGLMTIYALSVYNHVFSRGAALSPSLWLSPNRIRDMITNADIRENTWLYMDYGSEELDNHIGDKILQAFGRVYEAFLKKGVMGCARIVPGGTHSEASWQRQVPVFMECLEMNGWDEK